MLETNCCPLCNSKDIKKLKDHIFKFPGEDIQNHLLDSTYVRLGILFERILKKKNCTLFSSMICQNCGLIFTNPRFSMDDFRIKYDTINELSSVKYRLEQNPPYNLESRARRIYSLISKHFHSDRQGKPKILDYGGAAGYNLIPFTNNFECGVLDYEKWELPKGVKYLGKDLSALKDKDRFDLILLLHTLEHVPDPKIFLEDLCTYLKAKGIIYVEVPLGCFREWQSIAEPLTHVNFFSEESLFNCFRYCGLNVIYLSTSYQWVTHGKMWCANIIGTKQKHYRANQVVHVLSTKKQMNRIIYYLQYILHRRVIQRFFKGLKEI